MQTKNNTTNYDCRKVDTIITKKDQKITKKHKLRKIRKIGQGAYGSVYQCLDLQSQNIVALKIIVYEQQDSRNNGIPSTALRQISLLKRLGHHPNIINLLSYSYELGQNGKAPQFEMIFQFAQQDLSKYIKRRQTIDKMLMKQFMFQLITGVKYIHAKGMMHRDLKPQNILVSDKGTKIKIADFGLGRNVHFPLQTYSKQIQTLWYRAPQLLLGNTNYGYQVDTWSIGCILYQLYESRPLFYSQSEIGTIFQIFKFAGTPVLKDYPECIDLPFFTNRMPKFKPVAKNYKYLDATALDLLRKLLDLNPKNRLTLTKALEHAYFDQIKPIGKIKI